MESGRAIIQPKPSDPSALTPGVDTAAGLQYFLAAPGVAPELTEYYRNVAHLSTPTPTGPQQHLMAACIYGESSGMHLSDLRTGRTVFRDIFVCGTAAGADPVYTVGEPGSRRTHWVNGITKEPNLAFRHLSHVYDGLSTADYVAAFHELSTIFENRPAGQANIYFEGPTIDGAPLPAPTLLGFADSSDGTGIIELSIHSYPNPTGAHHELVLQITKIQLDNRAQFGKLLD